MFHYMPTFIHKILIHGPEIIDHAMLPIGELSEEAQEAKNKDVKQFREHHTRKISHLKTNEELFLRLLLSSDPHLSSLVTVKYAKKQNLDVEVIELLNIPEEDFLEEDPVTSSEDEDY